jgi:hypothetical protein
MAKSVISTPAFDVSALAESAVQFRLRNGGTGSAGASAYLQATRALAGWAKVDADNRNLVHALVHLGWTSTSGARKTVSAASSAAWKDHAEHVLEVGSNAAEAVATVLEALQEAGAPAEVLATVWTTFTAEA